VGTLCSLRRVLQRKSEIGSPHAIISGKLYFLDNEVSRIFYIEFFILMSSQNRNVLFSGFRFYGFFSLIFMTAELETPPPRVTGGRSKSFSLPHHPPLFLLFDRPCGYLLKSQSSIFASDSHGTIDSILNHHLRGLDRILHLVKLFVMSYREVISQCSLRLHA